MAKVTKRLIESQKNASDAENSKRGVESSLQIEDKLQTKSKEEEELGVDVCRSSLEAVGWWIGACASSKGTSFCLRLCQSLLEQTVSRGRPPETLA